MQYKVQCKIRSGGFNFYRPYKFVNGSSVTFDRRLGAVSRFQHSLSYVLIYILKVRYLSISYVAVNLVR